jgi:outer membrane protein assembly factor BamA
MPLKKSESISLNDRFFLGGPLGLRGFTNRGVGPNKEGNNFIDF